SVAATAIFLFVIQWNDLLYPLLFIQSPEKRTLPLALLNFQGQFLTNYPMLFTGVVIASLPIVVAYVLLQRYFVAGMTAGATKGCAASRSPRNSQPPRCGPTSSHLTASRFFLRRYSPCPPSPPVRCWPDVSPEPGPMPQAAISNWPPTPDGTWTVLPAGSPARIRGLSASS